MRKLIDDQIEDGESDRRITVASVYDSIRRSNSSLKRRPKKLLEDSIDRVLIVIKEERDDSESVEGDFEGIEEPPTVIKVCFGCTLLGGPR